jgi:hypothetical protein
MKDAQEADYSYQVDKLLLLVAQRDKLPANSDQISALNVEILAVEDLVRSYQLVRTATLKAV